MTTAVQTRRTRNARGWQPKFLAALSASGNVLRSAEAAGVSRTFVYEYRVAHPDFAEAWNVALDAAAPVLEEEAWRRAVEGVEEPVFGRVGKDRDGQIGTVLKYSDALLTTLLKAAKPEKYRDRQQVELSGNVGASFEFSWRATVAEIENGSTAGADTPGDPPSLIDGEALG